MANPTRSSWGTENDKAFIARVAAFNRRAESKLRRAIFADTKKNQGAPSPFFRFTFAPGADVSTVNAAVAGLLAAGATADQLELAGSELLATAEA